MKIKYENITIENLENGGIELSTIKDNILIRIVYLGYDLEYALIMFKYDIDRRNYE